MNHQINLVDLDKDALKANLLTYLKNTDIGKQYDLDSDGTAIKMLVDLFSYNTLIWLHYLHLINKESFISTAQRTDSISKLLESTGFTVNNKNSAIALVQFTKTTSGLAQVDRFATCRGIASSNSTSNFYYIDELKTLDSVTSLPFYGGTQLIKELRINVNLDTQEYKIENPNVDIRTVRVSVNSVYWDNFTNDPTKDTNENSQVFFIVKKGKYYYLKFGKDLQSENINGFGKSIIESDVILLSYVVSSGSQGNGGIITSLSSNNTKSLPDVSITSNVASGGYDSPDLNYLKYIGTRYHSYKGLITKSDYEIAITSSGYLPSYTSVENKVAVFDGQNHNNNYGKIYFSVMDLGVDSDQIQSLISILQSKAIFGLVIEYLESQNYTGYLTLSCTRDPFRTTKTTGQLKDDYERAIQNAYGINEFNNSISKSNLILLATETDSGLILKDSNISISFKKTINLNENKTLYFYNPIESITTDLVSSNLSTSSVKFVSTTTTVPELNGFRYINATLSNGTVVKSKVGVYNPTTGFILFYDNVSVTDNFTITITPNTDQITPIKNMAVKYEVSSLTVT